MGTSLKTARFLVESRLAEAARGDDAACYELGIFYSTGAAEVAIDLIEAHKWFNLAALKGSEAAKQCRAEIAEDMTAREISQAQSLARVWLNETGRRAA